RFARAGEDVGRERHHAPEVSLDEQAASVPVPAGHAQHELLIRDDSHRSGAPAPPSRAGGDASRRRERKSSTEGAGASLLRGLFARAPMVMLRSRLQLGEGDLAVAVGVEPGELVGSALLLEDVVVVRELLGRQRAVPVGVRLCECLRLHGLALGLPVALGERRGAREHQGGREPSCGRLHRNDSPFGPGSRDSPDLSSGYLPERSRDPNPSQTRPLRRCHASGQRRARPGRAVASGREPAPLRAVESTLDAVRAGGSRAARASRYATFAWTALGANIAVILWGAFVRASGSGAGCGSHWPLCNGEVVPRSPSAATLIELGHRVSSGLALLLVAGLIVGAWHGFPRCHLGRRSAGAAGVFLVLEALIGAGLVLLELVAGNTTIARAWWMAGHLVNTFLLVAALTLTAWWSTHDARPRLRDRGSLAVVLGLAL